MQHVNKKRFSTVFLFLLLALGSFFSFPLVDEADAAPQGIELQNASYTGFSVTDKPVTLKDGKWQGESYDGEGASRPAIKLLAGSYPIADFNQDGSEDAAVLLSESGGGSGVFYYLAVVTKKEDKLLNVATTMLGDRLQIVEFGGENGAIVLKVVQAGPDDPSSNPSEFVTRTFTLKGNTLQEEKRVDKADRLSPDVMAEVTWVLAEWNRNEPAPSDPEISLVYQDGKFTGSSGCNGYFTDVAAEEMPGNITVGVIGTGRMICGPPIDTAEMRFQELLAAVTGFAVDNRQLLLNYGEGEGGGAMLFKQRKLDGPAQ